MLFSWNLFNHSALGQKSLHDILTIMSHQMMALGHGVMWDRENKALVTKDQGINIVVEGFTRTEWGSIARIKEAYGNGARFICVASEEPGPKGFNQGTSREMILRQQTFVEAAPFFEGILHLVPGAHVTEWFSQFCPTAYAELGFAPGLLRPGDNFMRREPRYDFGFFGSLSPRRYKILKTLARRIGTEKAIRIVASFPTQEERDEAMRDAKVIVQIRKFEEMGLVSSSRCNTALCVGRPVVAEPHLLSEPWDRVVKFSESLDRFYGDCIAVRAAWRGVRDDQFTKFKTLLNPQFCIGEPLAKIGIPNPRARAA